MVYLDYSATTPVSKELLKLYTTICKEYIGNVNSQHKLGQKSRRLLEATSFNLANILNCNIGEIIYTSGASESNSMAIIGTSLVLGYKRKHIITTKLEHKSVSDVMKKLEFFGYKIDYVKVLPNGQIDLKDLEEKICEDTILISICGVNAEVGYIQPLKEIRKVIDKKGVNLFFHSDLTQALGKIEIDLSYLDLASFSSHKIFAPIGCGILYKKRTIQIGKLVYGTTPNSPFRGGTPALPLIVTFAKAIEDSQKNISINRLKCLRLKNMLIMGLLKYPIKINSNENCIPEIVNFSLLTISNKLFVNELSNEGIYVSTNSACCSNDEISLTLKEVTNVEKIYTTSIRVSISHITTEEEIERFLKIFNKIWNKYTSKEC